VGRYSTPPSDCMTVGVSPKDIKYRNVLSTQLSEHQCVTIDRKNGFNTWRDAITQGKLTHVLYTPYYVRICEPSRL